MSRIGRMPITVPAGVTVSIADGNVVTVKGPKGELKRALRPEMIIKQEGSTITVERPSDDKLHRSLHGLTRTLLHNMVVGVTDGFKKELEVNGVGYRVAKEGKNLVMNLGYSHQVIVSETEGITIDVPAPNKIVINGCDKQVVGQFAAEVPEAIRKGIEAAKKNMITITLSGSTVPHETIGEAGAGRVLMKPAAPGTGVIAGGAVRAVVEAAGIKDIRTKCLRSNNPNNVVAAAFEGLKSMRGPEEVARIRGKSVEEILG